MKAGRSILMALVAGVFLWLVGGLAGDTATAQGCGGGCGNPTPPPCNTCGTPKPPVQPSCCTPNHNVYVPGVNVYVAPSVVVNTKVDASVNLNNNNYNNNTNTNSGSATAYATGSAFSGVLSTGGCCGGGQSFYTPPMATGYIQGLIVEGPERRQRIAYEATRSAMRRVIIQAFCLDDRDIPHPASQVTPDREITDYAGEIYPRIAGARLQYVVAEFRGEASAISCTGASLQGGLGAASYAGGPAGGAGASLRSCAGLFNGGQTVVCNKNDALYYTPDGRGSGALACRPQKPARDCNERSLLRRFGAGVKILTMVSTERYTAYREEVIKEQVTASGVVGGLALDGGVGGVAF